MKIISCPSPNFDERTDGQNPSMIIIHYTGTQTADEARDIFLSPAAAGQYGRVSPHYMIGENAEIYKFIDENKRAWHAGRASWGDCTDINSSSIGIEIWNTGHEFDFEDFIPAQINSLIELINDIRTRWDIPNKNILGHSDVAPGRKLDPGEKFPWHKLAKAEIGLMPQNSESTDGEGIDFFSTLRDYGYTFTDDKHVLLSEFRRHFLPHLLDQENISEEDIKTAHYLKNN